MRNSVNVLLIGGGAREHAIARATKRSKHKTNLFYCAPQSNPGITLLATFFPTPLYAHDNIILFAQKNKIDFVIIGPEAPLAAGLADDFARANIACVGPTKAAAQIESSKGFARALLNEYRIPGLIAYRYFTVFDEIALRAYLATLNNSYVVKADGLCGGKGVKVFGEHLHSMEETLQCCRDILGPFVIEEKIMGPEFSLISFTDGKTVFHFPPVQDHKRAYENDTGPNTGGMGSYTLENHLLPFLSASDVAAAQHINQLTIDALQQKTKTRYCGFLYGGFMLTRSGVKVIEFNARLGDPEAINLLSILKTDFVELCLKAIVQQLSSVVLQCEHKATVVKYVVPRGYPDRPCKSEIYVTPSDAIYFGAVIESGRTHFKTTENGEPPLFSLENEPSMVRSRAYPGATRYNKGGSPFSVDFEMSSNYFMMTGSRAIAVLEKADTIAQAEQSAEKIAASILGPVYYRRDIGTEKLISRYVSMVDEFV